MTNKNGQIDNQEEYDKELEWYKKTFKGIGISQMAMHPTETLQLITDTFNRAEKIGLFSKEQIDLERIKIVKALEKTNIKAKWNDLKEKVKHLREVK